jgi:hypothetical protein
MFRRRWVRWGIGVVVVLLLLAAGYYYCFLSGPWVRVVNDSPEPFQHISVFVRDSETVIGALAPGESRSIRVYPNTGSKVDILYFDSKGRVSRVTADCHIEPIWYGGTIEVALQGNATAEVRDGSWYVFPGTAAKPATHTKGITVEQPQPKAP